MEKLKWSLLLITIGVGCDFVPPKWDVVINLPLASRKILVKEMVKDTSNLDTIGIVEIEYPIDTTYIELKIDSFVVDTTFLLRDVTLSKTYTDTQEYRFAEIAPHLVQYHGTVVEKVTPLHFTVEESFSFFKEELEANVEDGSLYLAGYNGIPLEIDSLQLELFLPSRVEVKWYNIGVGEYRDTTLFIMGEVISSESKYVVNLWTKKGENVMIDTNSVAKVNSELLIERISSYKGILPPCTSKFDVNIPLQPFRVKLIVVDSGRVEISFFNPTKCFYLLKTIGEECTFLPCSVEVVSGWNDSVVIIEDDSVTPIQEDSLFLTTFFSTSGGIDYDTVDERDTFRLKLKIYNLYINEFIGWMDTTLEEEVFSYGEKIDYGMDVPPEIYFKDAYLYYDIYNQSNTNFVTTTVMKGLRGGIEVEELNLNIPIYPGENYQKITGDSIVEFINAWPDSVEGKLNVLLEGEIQVKAPVFIYGNIGIGLPFAFTIADTLKYSSEKPAVIEVPEEIREQKILKVNLLIDMINTINLEGKCYIYISDDSLDLEKVKILIPIYKESYRKKIPTGLEALLKSERLWSSVEVVVPPQEVYALVRDKFRVKSLLEIKVRVGG